MPGIPMLTFAHLQAHAERVRHGIFTREGGVSVPPFASLNVSYSVKDAGAAVRENRARCASALGLPPTRIVCAGLVHGTTVARVEEGDGTALPDGSRVVQDVDVLVTATPEIGLLITAADCLQVLLYDPLTPAIGIAHAGWRGLAGGVLSAAVTAMGEHFGTSPNRLLAGIGPGLGPCCARFSDPIHELPPWFAPYIHDSHVDLWAAARDQLVGAGLASTGIAQHAVCTVCERDRFFSHRGDHGRTGRFAAIVALSG
ncbi:MAG: polyphenol oxidase family protein [Chloroflexota bacterium]